MKFDKKFYQNNFFKLERYRVSADKVSADEPELNEASLKITVPAINAEGKAQKKYLAEYQPRSSKYVSLTATAGGGGTVDALDQALRKLLEPIYPFLRHVQLVRYSVQSTQSTTSSVVEVFILSKNKQGKLYFSEVSSVSVIEASFFALSNIYNRYFKDYYLQNKACKAGGK